MNISRKKGFFSNLMLVIISLTISFLLAEFFLRDYFPINPGTSFLYRIPHPVLGWALEPGVRYANKMEEGTVRVAYNSTGWRDIEHTLEKPHGVFRILVLGDSFMEAYSVELKEAFHRKLEKIARSRTGKDIEVINLGVGGYGTLQEYLAFREIGQLYKPDLVLLGFYLQNDVRNNSFELESIVRKGSMKLRSRPFLEFISPTAWKVTEIDFEGARHRFAAEKAPLNSFGRRLVRQSSLLQAIESATKRNTQVKPPISDHPRKANTETIPVDQDRKYLALYGENYCAEPPEYTRAWNISLHILSRLKQSIEDINSTFFVFTVPALSDVSPTKMEQVRSHSLNPGKLCLEEVPGYKRLKDVLEELNIEFVDILPEFRTVMRNEGINLFRQSDLHWNSAGHSLAANIVVSALVEKNLLPLIRKIELGQGVQPAPRPSQR